MAVQRPSSSASGRCRRSWRANPTAWWTEAWPPRCATSAGTPSARVFRSEDYGRTWSAAEAPVVAGEAAGLTSISMADDLVGTAFGGNLADAEARTANVARTTDGGQSWTPLPQLAMQGAAFGGVHLAGTGGRALLAVGPGRADLSVDGGRSWRTVNGGSWWGIGSVGSDGTWIVGPEGRIARVRLRCSAASQFQIGRKSSWPLPSLLSTPLRAPRPPRAPRGPPRSRTRRPRRAPRECCRRSTCPP